MAARIRKTTLDHQWRAKIRASMLINRLENHVDGKTELSATQVTAALGLLRKCVPDLSATQLTGANDGPINLGVRVLFGRD